MRVLINATSFGAHPSGARNRFESIYPAFIHSQPGSSFTFLISKDYVLPHEVRILDNVREIRLPINSSNKLLRRLFFALLPLIYLAVKKFDVIEDMSQPPTLLRAERRLLTIHDIRRLEMPSKLVSYYGYKASLWLCRLLRYRVITVSKTIARSLSIHYPAGLISVVENSVPIAFQKNTVQTEKTTTPSGRYILAVGHIEARKNYARLVKAFGQFSNNWMDIRLVIVGKDNGEEQSIRALITELDQQNRIELRTNISDAELVDLYRSALFLVFPSVYEGFGIPLLEAMSTSCPLVISDIDVFHEIAGDAALYFSPYEIDEIRSSINALLVNDQLRSELSAKAKQRLGEYSTKKLVQKLRTIYASK